MEHRNRFLTAEWLAPFVPAGTELDSFEGATYLSLVGFEFNKTRILGLKVPLHQGIEEVNLRFYVKRFTRRGVVFVKELVPKRAVAAVTRLAFGENYAYVPMSHRIERTADDGVAAVEYSWGSSADRCSARIETEGEDLVPPEGSVSQFITEHYWGYAAQRIGCLEYEVQHP